MHARQAVKRDGQREQKLDVAAPTAIPLEGQVVSPPDSSTQGGVKG
jgi:hypothetical protein